MKLNKVLQITGRPPIGEYIDPAAVEQCAATLLGDVGGHLVVREYSILAAGKTPHGFAQAFKAINVEPMTVSINFQLEKSSAMSSVDPMSLTKGAKNVMYSVTELTGLKWKKCFDDKYTYR